jgi:hypothetical protein
LSFFFAFAFPSPFLFPVDWEVASGGVSQDISKGNPMEGASGWLEPHADLQNIWFFVFSCEWKGIPEHMQNALKFNLLLSVP